MSGPERREQLLDVARQLVSEHSFYVSIDGIARQAGITRPVVYSHFPDLDELLGAMLDREGARALAQLAEVFPEDSREGLDQRLLGTLRSFLEVVHADPVTWRLLLMQSEGAPVALRQRIDATRDGVIAVLANLVGSGPGGEPFNPELGARLLSAVAIEGAGLMLKDERAYPPNDILEQARWLIDRL
jgi:AcrR family transcriptional regulator